MAKVKSVKFYNFTELGDYISLNVCFYDKNKNLIPLDLSNLISKSATYCETNEYIITSNSAYPSEAFYGYNAFHTGNINKYVGLGKAGNCWMPSNKNDPDNWLKIEFKTASNFGDIKVIHSYSSDRGFTSCNYDIAYDSEQVISYQYVSNGKLSTIPYDVMYYMTFDQYIVNSQLDSIEFNKIILAYDSKIGYVETLDTNNFKNIPVNTVERLKSLCIKPYDTYLNCLISFDKKQTWKTFDGINWSTVSDISPENIILNGMELIKIDKLDKNKLIAGGFTGDLDFKIAMKTNDVDKTPSITKIYIEYK